MATRITTYFQAFSLIGAKYNNQMKEFVSKMERKGHTEKSICYAIWRSKDKLAVYSGMPNFEGILYNEIRKWSWEKDDPRWQKYWDGKKEIDKAVLFKNMKPDIREYICFVQGANGGSVRIELTSDPQSMIRNLQTGYPDRLRFLLILSGNKKKEQELINELKPLRLKGDWYKPAPALIDKIAELSKQSKAIEWAPIKAGEE